MDRLKRALFSELVIADLLSCPFLEISATMIKDSLCELGRCEATSQAGSWYQIVIGTNKRTDNLVMFSNTQATSMALIIWRGGGGMEKGLATNKFTRKPVN